MLHLKYNVIGIPVWASLRPKLFATINLWLKKNILGCVRGFTLLIRPCLWPAESLETPLDSRGWPKETIRHPSPQVKKAHVLPCRCQNTVISFTATPAVVRQMIVNLGLRLKAGNTHLVYVNCCSTVLQVSTPLPQLTC